MRSAECKCEYLAVETALNAAREETEEESADQKDLWMLYQLLGICGGSFSDILLFVHPFVFTEDGHWESDNNCNKTINFLKPQVPLPIIRNPMAGRIWMPEQMMKGQARLGTSSEFRVDPL